MDERVAKIFNDAMPIQGSLEIQPARSNLVIEGAEGQRNNWNLPDGGSAPGGNSNSSPAVAGTAGDSNPPTISDVIIVFNGTPFYTTLYGIIGTEV